MIGKNGNVPSIRSTATYDENGHHLSYYVTEVTIFLGELFCPRRQGLKEDAGWQTVLTVLRSGANAMNFIRISIWYNEWELMIFQFSCQSQQEINVWSRNCCCRTETGVRLIELYIFLNVSPLAWHSPVVRGMILVGTSYCHSSGSSSTIRNTFQFGIYMWIAAKNVRICATAGVTAGGNLLDFCDSS